MKQQITPERRQQLNEAIYMTMHHIVLENVINHFEYDECDKIREQVELAIEVLSYSFKDFVIDCYKEAMIKECNHVYISTITYQDIKPINYNLVVNHIDINIDIKRMIRDYEASKTVA